MGLLWEHVVLNEIHAHLQTGKLHYWRDKRGHEVDFVFITRGRVPYAIECKWTARDFDPANLKAFRRSYQNGDNLVVAHDVDSSFKRSYGEITVKFVSLAELINVVCSR